MKALTLVLSTFLLLFMVLLTPVAAEVVGKITQVEGSVQFLKGGKLPAVEARQDNGVEVGDVVRTKSLSKAQITFIDNTVITVSPESRLAIEAYMIDLGKGKRNAVLELFQGMAHVVVSKLFKVVDPDFVVKTHTAVMGVRGTEFGIRLLPNSSTILNFAGHTEVGNIFPEVGDQQFKKAEKSAYAWGGANTVQLHDMQGTTVAQGLPPTLPFTITDQDRQMFMRQLSGAFQQALTRRSTGVNAAVLGGGAGTTSGSGLTGAESALASSALEYSSFVNNATGTNILTQPIITPTLVATTQQPVLTTYSFAEIFSGSYSLTSTTANVGIYTNTDLGSGTRTGVYAGTFSAAYTLTATGPSFASFNTGTISVSSITGTLTGNLGQTLTGTITIPNLVTSGGTTFNLTGPVTLSPNGTLTAGNLTGTISLGGVTGTVTGNWNQTSK